MNLDIKTPIRLAIVADMALVAMLGRFESGPSVHTSRPVPQGAEYPMIIIDCDDTREVDALASQRPVVSPQIAVYGQNPRDSRVVDEISYTVRELFHRNRWVLDLTAYGLRTVLVTVAGPRRAPTDDETTIGRILIPTMQLQAT